MTRSARRHPRCKNLQRGESRSSLHFHLPKIRKNNEKGPPLPAKPFLRLLFTKFCRHGPMRLAWSCLGRHALFAGCGGARSPFSAHSEKLRKKLRSEGSRSLFVFPHQTGATLTFFLQTCLFSFFFFFLPLLPQQANPDCAKVKAGVAAGEETEPVNERVLMTARRRRFEFLTGWALPVCGATTCTHAPQKSSPNHDSRPRMAAPLQIGGLTQPD